MYALQPEAPSALIGPETHVCAGPHGLRLPVALKPDLTTCPLSLWWREAGKAEATEPMSVSFRKRDGGAIQGASMEAAWEEGAGVCEWLMGPVPTPGTGDSLGGLASGLGLKPRRRSPLPAVPPPRVKTCSEKKAGRNPVLICLVSGN